MAKTVINVEAIVGLSPTIISAESTVGNVKSSFYSIRGQINGRVLNRNNLGNRLSSVFYQLSDIENRILNIKNTVERSANNYRRADILVTSWKNSVMGKVSSLGHIGIVTNAFSGSEKSKQDPFWSWEDTWKLAGKGGIVGSGISTVGGIITGGHSVSANLKTAKGAVKVAENIAKAIPNSKSSFNWKTLIGFNSDITKDTPKSFSKILGENVEKLKLGNAKIVSDKVAVGAKWSGKVLTAMITTYENFTDTSENNSIGRKVAESIGETAVKVGEELLIGAGVTAVFAAASVGAPVVVIGAVTVGVTWAVDKVCEAFTKKDVAELVSDAVLDVGEKVAKTVGKAAKKVTGAVSGWWEKTFG